MQVAVLMRQLLHRLCSAGSLDTKLQAAERVLRLIWHDPNGLRLLFGSWVKVVVWKLRRAERI
jgi:hypothetical protein